MMDQKTFDRLLELKEDGCSLPYLMESYVPGVRADLRDADLREANLHRANLREANLSNADLREANLHRANLREANLSNADLREANLHRANLHRANLSNADLSNADLSGADLSGADLREADLSWANLSDADLREANLSGADLREANLSGCTGLQSPIAFMAQFEHDEFGFIVYKGFGNTDYNTPDYWTIEPGAFITEVINQLPTLDCACGVNFATREWIEEIYPSATIWRCRIRYEDAPGITVPYHTDGKARCERLELLEPVES